MLQSVIVGELRLVLACYRLLCRKLRLVLACLNTVCYCRRAQTGFGMLQSVTVGELRLVLACYRLLCNGAQTSFGMFKYSLLL